MVEVEKEKAALEEKVGEVEKEKATLEEKVVNV